MTSTRANIIIPEGVWTNLYSASGIAVKTAVDVYNAGSSACFLAISLLAPSDENFGIPLYPGSVGNTAHVDADEIGLWVYCPQGATSLVVQECY